MQARYLRRHPYCNAFHPPSNANLKNDEHAAGNDHVMPPYNPKNVFECKYELDSLASFFKISRSYWELTGDNSFCRSGPDWIAAVVTVLDLLDAQSASTFDATTGKKLRQQYTFQRSSPKGTETQSLDGAGFPTSHGTGMIRSAFRPSDDATIFQFLVPANAYMSVELGHLAKLLRSLSTPGSDRETDKLVARATLKSQEIRQGIFDYAVTKHGIFGEVFAYEVDGYGSALYMDDANVPSLLSLPLLGFVNNTHPIYQNTRRMVLSRQGNPYYLEGPMFSGIGGPHVGTQHAWPMASIVRCLTSDDKEEVRQQLEMLKQSTAGLGLMHESVNVLDVSDYTRPWFSWASGMFADLLLDIRVRMPELLMT